MEKKIFIVEDDEIYRIMIRAVIDSIFVPQEVQLHFIPRQMLALHLIMWHRVVLKKDADLIILDGILSEEHGSAGHGRNVLRIMGKVDRRYFEKEIIFSNQSVDEFFLSEDQELAEAAKGVPFISKCRPHSLEQAIKTKFSIV